MMSLSASATTASARVLSGQRILVTRPAAQCATLIDAIAAAGGMPLRLPLLEIHDAADPAALQAVIDRLDTFDLAVFVSPNAIERACTAILARRAWPVRLRVAAVGPGSERALAGFGLHQVIAPPQRFDSEGLLELPALQDCAGWRVIIFRGDGGRELIAQTLAARGATVEFVACYRRTAPTDGAARLQALWQQGPPAALVLTSSEALQHLGALTDALGPMFGAGLRQIPLFAPHDRIAATARAQGFAQVVVTAAGDAGILQGLLEYFAGNGEPGEHGN
jgi:uroporphyrinogen-III synthase